LPVRLLRILVAADASLLICGQYVCPPLLVGLVRVKRVIVVILVVVGGRRITVHQVQRHVDVLPPDVLVIRIVIVIEAVPVVTGV